MTRLASKFTLSVLAIVLFVAANARAAEPAPPHGLELAWAQAGRWVGVSTTPRGEILAGFEFRLLVKLNAAGEKLAQTSVPDRPVHLRAANLGGDNESEVITFGMPGSAVNAYTAKGKLLWSHDQGPGGVNDVWAWDLTGDGLDEVIVGFGGSTGIHVLDNAGKLLWSDTSIGNVWHVTAGNTDRDAQPEVVTTCGGGRVHIVNAAGKHLRDLHPQIYCHMVRTWLDVNGEDPYDMILVAGTADKKEVVCGLDDKGVELWRLDLPASVESAATCPRRPWLAIALANGTVQVIDVHAGQVIGEATDQGQHSDIAWLQVEDEAPLLLVTTGDALRAYRISLADAK
jgi:hypothetical protein